MHIIMKEGTKSNKQRVPIDKENKVGTVLVVCNNRLYSVNACEIHTVCMLYRNFAEIDI